MTQQPLVILGSGATGVSLALAASAAGIPVTLVEPDPNARERAESFARKDDAEAAQALRFTADRSALSKARLVFDALDPEDRDHHSFPLPAAASVATPFSTPLPKAHGERIVRLVPFQPMQLRHLTELMRFDGTSDDTLGDWYRLAQSIGRVPVILPPGAPSIGLQLQDRLHATTDDMLLKGAVLWELDEAMTTFGFDLGFYEGQDLTGLDVAYARRKAQGTPSKIADRAVEEGRIGKKIGWGWYRYPGGGGAVIDPLIEDLIREEAWFAKVDQRSFSADEVMDTLLTALSGEVRAIRASRLVASDNDLAQILVHGLGYPQAKLDLLGL